MASAMSTTANGVKVVTYIVPLEEDASEKPEDLKTNLLEPEKPSLPPITQIFRKGQPLSLGVLQVFIGLVIMSLSLIAVLINTLTIEIIFCLGLPFVASGLVAIVAHKTSSPVLIKGTMLVSVLCAMLAAGGVGYFSWQLSIRPEGNACINDEWWSCRRMESMYRTVIDGVKGLLLVLSCLELCVCIALSVFSSKALREVPRSEEAGVEHYSSDSSLIKEGLDSSE